MGRNIYQMLDINVKKRGLTINLSINCELGQMRCFFLGKIEEWCGYDGVAKHYLIHCNV